MGSKLEEAILPERFERIKAKKRAVNKMKSITQFFTDLLKHKLESKTNEMKKQLHSGRMVLRKGRTDHGESSDSLLMQKKKLAEKTMAEIELDRRKWKWVPSRSEKTEFRSVRPKHVHKQQTD